jgi:hypothetical protein
VWLENTYMVVTIIYLSTSYCLCVYAVHSIHPSDCRRKIWRALFRVEDAAWQVYLSTLARVDVFWRGFERSDAAKTCHAGARTLAGRFGLRSLNYSANRGHPSADPGKVSKSK